MTWRAGSKNDMNLDLEIKIVENQNEWRTNMDDHMNLHINSCGIKTLTLMLL